MARHQEKFEIIDPLTRQAVEIVRELQQLSNRNQALLLRSIRQKDPQLASRVVSALKGTAPAAHDVVA